MSTSPDDQIPERFVFRSDEPGVLLILTIALVWLLVAPGGACGVSPEPPSDDELGDAAHHDESEDHDEDGEH